MSKAVVSASLVACLAVSATPTVAFAQQSSGYDQRVQDALTELTMLNIVAEQSQNEFAMSNEQLNATEQLVSELDQKITQLDQDLVVAKDNLSTFVADSYKFGTISLLDIILQSSSLDEMVSRIVYENRIAEHQRQAIEKVDDLYSALVQNRYELENALATQKRLQRERAQRLADVAQAGSTVNEYFSQLSPEMREAMVEATDEQRELAAKTATEVLQTALESVQAQPESTSGSAAQPEVNSSSAEPSAPVADAGSELVQGLLSTVQANATEQQAASNGDAASVSTQGQAAASSASYDDLLQRAYSLLGSSYQYSGYNWTGDTDSSAFTCSGVVDYALGRESQSSTPESLYEEVGSNISTDVSSFSEGDLVFYSYDNREVGHVGIYVGDGYVIDSIPNGGVAIRNVDYMNVVGGGSL